MQNVDANFITCLTSRSRWDEITGTIVLNDNVSMPITLDQIVENSVSVTWDSDDGKKDISFGVSVCSELDITLFTDFDRYALEGSTLTVNYRVWDKMPEYDEHDEVSNEAIYSDCPIGIFTAITVTKDMYSNKAHILAYDNIKKLDKTCGSQVFAGNSYEILAAVCLKTNLTIGMTQQQMAALFPNVTVAMQFDETTGAKTYRDIVRYVCQLLGACARVNRATGALELFKYSLTTDYTLAKTERREHKPADYMCKYRGIQVTSVKGTYKSINTHGTGMVMYIDDAPAWDYGTKDGLQLMINTLGSYVKQIVYTPCDVSAFSNPMFDCGDRLSLAINADPSNNIEILVTSVTWKFRGGTEIKSIGSNLQETGVQSESARQASRSADANKLVSYDVTNADNYTLNDEDTQLICDVSFTSAQATHAMWLANILLETEADEGYDYTDVKVTYYYDNTELEFYPQEHYSDGKHDFSLFFPISAISEQAVHRWQVEITSLNGSTTIASYDFRGTLFGQNLVEEAESWDGIIELEDFIEYITPIIMVSNITESNINIMLMGELRSVFTDTIQAVLVQANALINMAETCNIELMYRDDVCFCGENYYAGTEGVLL